MKPVWLDHDGNSSDEPSFKELPPPGSPDISDVFGDPQVNTRVGDEFQAEIPPMLTESERLQLLTNPAGSEATLDVSLSFLMGLPVPIMWVHDEVNDIKDEGWRFSSKPDDASNANEPLKTGKSKKIRSNMKKKDSKVNVEQLGVELVNGKESKAANLGLEAVVKAYIDQPCKNRRCHPLPGSSGDAWTDAEVDNFLLGLYIFKKNFVQVKKFIENKEMGEILSLYYGEFYRSDGYRRWSDCRKTRSRKCVYGKKIFSGWRQQELLSRLLPHVPEESQTTLLEVSKSFAEERTSIENYVFSLKTIVGIRALVKAVGIGKGKEDLTSLAMVPVKTKVFPVCPKIPTGKACSSLTSSDIIKFLTGGFRLSKTRCNDIFWEAVWPRLLAKGWHSEQPKNRSYVSSKHFLVFLMPGIRKFSRRKLVKGDHYFDSVSDILSKVASEPKLLELETEEAGVSGCHEENGWVPEVPSDQDDPSDNQPHCYLKPRVSTCNSKRTKFTVVDSSLVHGGKSSKMRELRYSPVDFKITSKVTGLSREKEGCFFEESLNEHELDAADIPLNDEKKVNNVVSSQSILDSGGPNCMKVTVVDTSLVHGGKSSQIREIRCLPFEFKITSKRSCSSRENEGGSSEDSLDEHEPDAVDTPLNGEPDADHMLLDGDKNANTFNRNKSILDCGGSNENTHNSDAANETVESQHDQKINTSEDHQAKRTVKQRFNRRPKSGHSNNLAPLLKRRRLTACSNTETSSIIENFSIHMRSKQGNNTVFQVGPSQKKLSLNNSSAEVGQGEESSGGMHNGNCFGTDMSHRKNEKLESRPSVDMNQLQVPQDSENELPMTEVEDSQAIISNGPCFPSNTTKLDPVALRTSVDVGAAEQQTNMNPRRQSTRNRPLTTRALEALESGFLNVRRQKSKEVRTREIPFSSPSRRARSRVKVTSNRDNAGSGIVDSKEEIVVNEAIANKDMVSKPLDQIDKKSLTIS